MSCICVLSLVISWRMYVIWWGYLTIMAFRHNEMRNHICQYMFIKKMCRHFGAVCRFHRRLWRYIMMTSSNENVFRVTGHLCGEFTGPGEFPHKGQWRRALMFSLICVWINDWVNNREAGDLRRYRVHYDVTVMFNIRKVWPTLKIVLDYNNTADLTTAIDMSPNC